MLEEGPFIFRCVFWSLLLVWVCTQVTPLQTQIDPMFNLFVGGNVHVVSWWFLPLGARHTHTERYREALLRANHRALPLFCLLCGAVVGGGVGLVSLGLLLASVVCIVFTIRDITNAAFAEMYAIQSNGDAGDA